MKFENKSFYYLNNIMIDLNKKNAFSWRKIVIKNNILVLEALDDFWMPREKYFYFCKIGNKIIFPKFIENNKYDFITLYGLIEKGRIFLFEIPLEIVTISKILYFYISYLDVNIEIFPSLGKYTHIPNINNGYYIFENFIIKYIYNRLIIYPYNKNLEIEFEKIYCSELYKYKKYYIIKLRRKYFKNRNKLKQNKRPENWIISDGLDRAGGNGEYFFRYLKMKKPKGVKPFYVILKNCPDYKRLKKLGNILDVNSYKYKNIFLESKKIISSIYNFGIYNPYKKDQIYIRDIINFDAIFFQNSILKDDLSKYINKFDKNFNLIVTSSKSEYKVILKSKYGYDKNNVILTGMPRYDNLQRLKRIINLEKKIIIIPDKFKLIKFLEFYEELINDKRLLFNMKKKNFTGILCLESQTINFRPNELFSIIEKCDYQNLTLTSSLLITDNSNIFFDFGYMRKPVIYTHFDYNVYRRNSYEKGYFDYKKDGFGPICKDIKCIINEIIFEINNKCVIRKKYLEKIQKFFAFYDEQNSQRIFDEISKLNYKYIKQPNHSIFFYFVFLMSIISYGFIKFYNILNWKKNGEIYVYFDYKI